MAQGPKERLRSNLKAEMARRDLRPRSFALSLGIAPTTFYRRLDEGDWTVDELIRMARAMDMPLAELLDGVEDLYADAEPEAAAR